MRTSPQSPTTQLTHAKAAALFAECYGRHADRYASFGDPILAPLATGLLRAANLSGGERVLDLATGTGAIARLAAQEGASVIGIDVSPGMIALARKLSSPSVLFEVADAVALPFPDGSFDVVTCGLGLSHFQDTLGALGEVRRVLRAGGRLIASTWGRNVSGRASSAVGEALRRRAGPQIHFFAGLLDEASWADARHGCDVLRRAGFEPVRAITETLSGTYPSAEMAVEYILAFPNHGETLDRLNPEERAAVRDEALAALRATGEAEWHAEVHYYAARRTG